MKQRPLLTTPRAIVALLAVFIWGGSLIIAVQQLPHDGALGQDFLVFYAAGLVVRHGDNPYSGQLATIEAHLHMIGNPASLFSFNPFGNPPLFSWIMSAFTHWSPAAAYVVWLVCMVLVSIASLIVMGRSYGITGGGWGVLTMGLTPVFIIAFFLGQPTPLLALSLASTLAALRAERPVLAGLLLSLCWLKPHLVFPLLPVLLVMLPFRQARQLALGLLGGSLAILSLPLLLMSPATVAGWLGQLWRFYVMTTSAQQPGLASIAGAYVSVVSPKWARVLTLLCLVLWIAILIIIARYVRVRRLPVTADAWTQVLCVALAAWLFLAPYAHPADLVVLVAIAAPLLVGRYGEGLADKGRLLALCAIVAAPEVDLLGFRPSLYFCYSVLVPFAIILALLPWQTLIVPIRPRSMQAAMEAWRHG